jgi:hypothetical protein
VVEWLIRQIRINTDYLILFEGTGSNPVVVELFLSWRLSFAQGLFGREPRTCYVITRLGGNRGLVHSPVLLHVLSCRRYALWFCDLIKVILVFRTLQIDVVCLFLARPLVS